MKQSRTMSLAEAGANVVVGFGAAVCAQMVIFPLFGLEASMREHVAVGAVFTVVSVARSYALRRLFEAIRVRGAGTETTSRGPGDGWVRGDESHPVTH